ncbi:hypothetical protein GGTG_14058 [Gaeumannomyces tritici R3-111a-1]|uniref:5'-3' DNA helicase ZGRF1-like N-terminal domain-containing protein n=1 Tax=Gaeumannomyces tritici (strain R3-111a-1) TaxID=644352 RepID=J3PKK0_GAET3|nr:hypothetical protein GGTG_14058 [Gaeumannomyces tritici R3-111a-1]EJT68362.1 hypothetical protein GGTG_14058 [Gaeumannomyces tritici R3-111a-1]
MANTPAQPTSTAPVLEHICLFTHDLKRKHKRWQDGRLKFHAFNQRVMVYDERGNFVGDAHWREDYDFGEGEELQLERGGTIVQVCECVGRRDQDLSELLDKRALDKSQRAAQVAARTPAASAAGLGSRPVVRQVPADHSQQLRHRPLGQLLGTPTGHHGRAVVPSESPFEQRHREAEDTPPAAKRPRREASPPSKAGYAQNLFGTKLCLSSQPRSSALTWPSQSRPVQPTAPAARPTSHLEGPSEVDAGRPGPPPKGGKGLERPTGGRVRPAAEPRDVIELDEDTADARHRHTERPLEDVTELEIPAKDRPQSRKTRPIQPTVPAARPASHAERSPDKGLETPARDRLQPAAKPKHIIELDKEDAEGALSARHAKRPLKDGNELERPAKTRARPAAEPRDVVQLDKQHTGDSRLPSHAERPPEGAKRLQRPAKDRTRPAAEPRYAVEVELDKENTSVSRSTGRAEPLSEGNDEGLQRPVGNRARPATKPRRVVELDQESPASARQKPPRPPQRTPPEPRPAGRPERPPEGRARPAVEPASVAERGGEAAADAQPRTELQIKPRRKHGLLMLSSRAEPLSPPPPPPPPAPEPAPAPAAARPEAQPPPPRREPRRTPSAAAPGEAPSAAREAAQAAIEKPTGVSTTTGPWSRREAHDLLGMGRPGGWDKSYYPSSQLAACTLHISRHKRAEKQHCQYHRAHNAKSGPFPRYLCVRSVSYPFMGFRVLKKKKSCTKGLVLLAPLEREKSPCHPIKSYL